VEAYAVLTRLPPPHRLSARDARDLLEASFLRQGTLVALDAAGYGAQLRDWPDRQVAGGQAYDAVILACAVKSRADVLLTLNPRHFLVLGEYGVEIVVPGQGA
jgi:predicted nucleic acid-binding protein